jgi:hypothetical protein
MTVINDTTIFDKMKAVLGNQVTLKIISSEQLRMNNQPLTDGDIVQLAFVVPDKSIYGLNTEFFNHLDSIKDCSKLSFATTEDFRLFYQEEIKPYYESIELITKQNPFELFFDQINAIIDYKESLSNKNISFLDRLNNTVEAMKTELQVKYDNIVNKSGIKIENKARH